MQLFKLERGCKACEFAQNKVSKANRGYLQPRPNKMNQIIVQGYCHGSPCNILLDTGATISLVSTRIVYLLGLERDIRPTRQLIAGLAKTIVPMRGEIDLPIQIGKSGITHTFVVSDNIDNEFLMGMDLMKHLRISIDIPNKTIYLSNEKVPFSNKPLSISNRMKLRCNKTIVIPAKTACFVQSKVPICNAKSNYEGVVEPYHRLAETKGIFVTGTISYSSKNLVPVYCINPMPWDVTIYKNQLIAFIEPFQPFDNIKEPHVIQKAYTQYDDFNLSYLTYTSISLMIIR